MTDNAINKWVKISFVNLAIVAIYGTLMRYKIAFNFPLFEQKNLLHAHSHFAFSGWISHVLYCALISTMVPPHRCKKYISLIVLNLLSAYGMLIAFTMQGYKTTSICFSTLSIVITILFTCFFISDFKHLPGRHFSKEWAITGLSLNVISCIGPLSLAYMIATRQVNVDIYLASVYYYLHFQYNGWFFFTSMALIACQLPIDFPSLKKYYFVFASTVIPTFFLSVLWMKLPFWLSTLTAIATFLQTGIWIAMLFETYAYSKNHGLRLLLKWPYLFFFLAGLALTIKFLLQMISIVPSLSQLVFGIRPIIIAYLHLVLLGVYSLFLLGLLFFTSWIVPTKYLKHAAIVFIIGVIMNELFLAIQGFSAFTYTYIPGLNYMLFGAALLLLTGAASMAFLCKGRVQNRL